MFRVSFPILRECNSWLDQPRSYSVAVVPFVYRTVTRLLSSWTGANEAVGKLFNNRYNITVV